MTTSFFPSITYAHFAQPPRKKILHTKEKNFAAPVVMHLMQPSPVRMSLNVSFLQIERFGSFFLIVTLFSWFWWAIPHRDFRGIFL